LLTSKIKTEFLSRGGRPRRRRGASFFQGDRDASS